MRNLFIIGLFFSILFISCDTKGVFENNLVIPNEEWELENIANFSVSIDDTIASHNIYANIRNTTSFPNSNLYLFITTHAPNGAMLRDTLECILANTQGDWLGKGFGRIRDNQIPYKSNIRFPITGIYRFEIQHGMRAKNLKEVVSVGLRIERTN
jgi:gliding motility-associated lipoprotein GldH